MLAKNLSSLAGGIGMSCYDTSDGTGLRLVSERVPKRVLGLFRVSKGKLGLVRAS